MELDSDYQCILKPSDKRLLGKNTYSHSAEESLHSLISNCKMKTVP